MMKRKLVWTMMLLTLVLSAGIVVSPIAAANYSKIGVRTGDYAVYSTRYTLSTANRTYVFVSNAVDTFSNLTITDYFADGSLQQSYAVFGNVSKGEALVWYWLVPANLSAGDLIYDGASRKVNETITMMVAGASRSVNYVGYNIGTIVFDIYYDRATGIMVRENIKTGYSWGNRTMISTNLWQPDGPIPPIPPVPPIQIFNIFSLAWLICGLVVGFVAAALIMRGKRKK
jgi:hypothetical protein